MWTTRIKVIGIAVDNNWNYLTTGYGLWYLVGLLGFVALPCYQSFDSGTAP